MHDFHTHFIPSDVITWLKDNKELINAKWTKTDENKNEFLVVNEKWGFELKQAFIDSERYLQEQAAAGVSHSVVSPIPQLFLYDFPDEITTEISNVYNRSLAEWSKSAPQKSQH